MTRRQRQRAEFVTMGHIRGHGCRDLLVYCTSQWCNHRHKWREGGREKGKKISI